MNRTITVEIAPGELIDKIAILEIKIARIADAAKLRNVRAEWETLTRARDAAIASSPEIEAETAALKRANETLWEVEDHIRECERNKDFGPRFVALARSVYVTNDARARIKRRLNELLGSRLIEEKSYASY
ncbi:MAG: hypothetical protein A3G73_08650 [Rhodospirillales bacterium RIFCSPLOWO2_12_FULL_67_15]|nr:MAG: hypothetical protein A3G73_08650 [Rhodospirillales bacterium RIFCSPLOWO2_12_FULL_67_15]